MLIPIPFSSATRWWGAAICVTTFSLAFDAFALPPLPPPMPESSTSLPPVSGARGPAAAIQPLDMQATAALPAVAEADVKSILFNPYGEADGLRLVNDVIVKFPPHRAQALLAVVQPGQHVRILGHAEPGVRMGQAMPAGIPAMVKADAIINVTTGNIVVDQPPTPGLPLLPPHLRAQTLQPLQVEGRVDLVLNSPRGEMEGVILDNQSIVRFPPESLNTPLRPGMHLVVAGLGSKTASGFSLEAMRMGSSAATMQPLYAPACQAVNTAAGQC